MADNETQGTVMGDERDDLREVTDRVVKLEEELEASGVASIAGSEVEWGRTELHRWVDEMIGFVASPGLGRVTIVHPGGKRSSIASSTLPYLMSRPLK